jgi:tetratricopeptide (TPR) repeat protein
MVEAVYNLANVYFEMERFEQAASFYRKAIEINPGFHKALDGLTRTEQKLKPQSGGLFDDEEAGPMDPFAGDPRVDRVLSPDHDFDVLARCHAATLEAKEATEAWVKISEELRLAVRDLAIGISTYGGGPDVQDYVNRFRDAAKRFRRGKALVEEKRVGVGKLRDLMADRG